MDDELKERIKEVAENPASMSTGAGSVREQSINDLIQADRYLAGNQAINKPHRGLRITKIVPPGAG